MSEAALDAILDDTKPARESLKRAATAPRLTDEQAAKLNAMEEESAAPLTDDEVTAAKQAAEYLRTDSSGNWMVHKTKGTSLLGEKRALLHEAKVRSPSVHTRPVLSLFPTPTPGCGACRTCSDSAGPAGSTRYSRRCRRWARPPTRATRRCSSSSAPPAGSGAPPIDRRSARIVRRPPHCSPCEVRRPPSFDAWPSARARPRRLEYKAWPDGVGVLLANAQLQQRDFLRPLHPLAGLWIQPRF